MRYAEVYKDSEDHAWVTETWGYPRAVERHDFPTHTEALAHALAEVGLAPDPDPSRCPMRATDPITTRHPREDGWRCGHEAGHTGSHTLCSTEGESVLYPGRWVHPAEIGLTEKNTETGDGDEHR